MRILVLEDDADLARQLNKALQEAGYAGLGEIFGVPPELSLAVSLVRRARDIVVGVPILLVWQFVEVQRLRESKAAADAPASR